MQGCEVEHTKSDKRETYFDTPTKINIFMLKWNGHYFTDNIF